jgi:multimeric flavodoxin WrbA
MGNTEVLVREALMGAQEVSGAEIEIIRMHDLFIKPCLGCECNYWKLEGREVGCVQKNDHFQFLVEKLIECDGVILGAPCYGSRPPGYLLMISDRFMGVTTSQQKKLNEKIRPQGVISVGGSDMVGVMLPQMNTKRFMRGTQLVDQMSVIWTSRPDQVVLNDQAIARARKLGSNVGKAIKMPASKIKYLGNEDKHNLDDYYRSDFDLTTQLAPPLYEACPVCHSDLVRLRGKQVECPICYIKGSIEVKDGVASFICDPVGRPSPYSGEAGHWRHDTGGTHMHNKLVIEKKQEIKEKMEKYQADIPATKPPALKAKSK